MALLKTNTGIGTTNPISALHVIGDGLFTGVVTATSFNGNIYSSLGIITSLSSTNATLTNINSSGISTLGVTTTTRLTTQSIVSSGIVTASSFVPSSGFIKAPDGTDAFYIYSGTGNVAFQGTIGATQINNAQGYKVIGFAGTNNASFENNVYISGVTTSVGGFVGNLTGTASTASFATTAFTLDGVAESELKVEYARTSGIATYASFAGIATYSDNAGIATYATLSGIATYASFAGVATYALLAGIATYSDNAGIATYSDSSGIATYASFAGIATYAPQSGIATNVIGGVANVISLVVSSGISTLGITSVTDLTSQNITNSGIVTAVGGFVGNLTGTATTATKLETSRTFEITGDIVASPISFDGTSNVSLAATIQPNSVELGTDTFGDYVETISGTVGEIVVTSGTGEGSTPVISFDANPTIGGNVIIGNDLQVNNNLNVNGNITIGGTTGFILVENFRVQDADIVLGFTTDSQGNDVSNDTTADGGGIAIASTEGNPLVTLTNIGIGETLPSTYKKFMWFKAGSFAGLNTDAWLSNYAIGIGSTQFPSGTRLAAGSVQFTENDLAVVRDINASGIVTAVGGFVGNLTGTASTASFATTAFNLNGVVEADLQVAFAQTSNLAYYATSSGVSTNLKGGVAGNVPYQSAADTTTFVANGVAGQVLLFNGSQPIWANVSAASGAFGGITIYDEGNLVGTSGSVTDLNFVGDYVSAVGSGNSVTITLATPPYSTSAGVATYASVAGVATYASVAGISTTSQGLTGVPNIEVGIVTATEYYGTFKGTIDSTVTLGNANYASVAGVATYASIAGIATYSDNAGIATYASFAGIATYSDNAGISTVAEGLTGVPNIEVGIVTATEYYGTFKGTIDSTVTLGNANYALVAGIATYALVAGIATYSDNSGISTYATLSGIATYASIAGIATVAKGLTGVPNIEVGIVTATEYYGTFKGNIDSTVTLGNANYALVAGIATYASVAGVATYATLSGVATYSDNAGIATYAALSGISTYASVSGIATVAEGLTGVPNIEVGIVTATEYYGNFKGTIDSTVTLGNANYALVAGIATYASVAGVATYASVSGISTVAEGLTGVPNIEVGIVTATEYYGNFKGTIDSTVTLGNANYASVAGVATYATLSGVATYSDNAGIATYASLAGIATYASLSGIATVAEGLTGVPNIEVGIVTATEYYGTFKGTIDSTVTLGNANYALVAGIATYASVAGVATYASVSGVATYATLSGVATYSNNAGIATYATLSGTSTSVVGGIASVTSLSVSGISTLGNLQVFSGIVTATSGIVTYYGDGSKLSNIISGVSISTNTTNQNQLIPFVVSTGSTTGFGVSSSLVFNPSTIRFGIGISNPEYIFTVTDTETPATVGLTNCLADFTTTANSYGQINLRNTSSGSNASGDIIITADNGDDETNYIDLGINNSGFSVGSWTINGANDGYLYTSDGNLSIGAINASTPKYISFFTGGTLITNERMRINATGIGIGTANPTSRLHVVGDASISGVVTCLDLNSSSDIKLKNNIKTVENALDTVSNLRGVSFNWKESGKSSYGVIAQELEEVLPDLVNGGETKSVNYNGIIAVLIESIKELKKEIEDLKKS